MPCHVSSAKLVRHYLAPKLESDHYLVVQEKTMSKLYCFVAVEMTLKKVSMLKVKSNIDIMLLHDSLPQLSFTSLC